MRTLLPSLEESVDELGGPPKRAEVNRPASLPLLCGHGFSDKPLVVVCLKHDGGEYAARQVVALTDLTALPQLMGNDWDRKLHGDLRECSSKPAGVV